MASTKLCKQYNKVALRHSRQAAERAGISIFL